MIVITVLIVLLSKGFALWQYDPFLGFAINAEQSALLILTEEVALTVANGPSVERNGTGFIAHASIDAPRAHGRTNSVFIQLFSDIEQAVSCKLITVMVRARSIVEQNAREFAAVYSTALAGNSGWKLSTLGDNWANYSLSYYVSVDPANRNPENDYFRSLANTYLDGGGVVVQRVIIDASAP